MKPIIFSGKTSIISSGTVISFMNEPIEIVIEPSDDTFYTMVFSFHKDEENKASSIKVKDLEGRTGIEFELYNFAGTLGTATIKPIAFATEVNTGKQLLINFAVSTIGEASPTLQYTVYKEM